MDQTCQDIPMRLDIKHQPLNFDIYLQQVIDIPKTSLEDAPYDFNLERQALQRVDQIIQRTINHETKSEDDERSNQQSNLQKYMDQSPLQPTTIATQLLERCNSHTSTSASSTHEATKVSSSVPATQTAITPSCPMEVPLTPIKCFIEPTNINDSTSSKSTTATTTSTTTTTTNYATSSNSNQESNSDKSKVNQINLKDFEEIHYNPFDHLELQTIDELRELDLVFQASYANQASKQL